MGRPRRQVPVKNLNYQSLVADAFSTTGDTDEDPSCSGDIDDDSSYVGSTPESPEMQSTAKRPRCVTKKTKSGKLDKLRISADNVDQPTTVGLNAPHGRAKTLMVFKTFDGQTYVFQDTEHQKMVWEYAERERDALIEAYMEKIKERQPDWHDDLQKYYYGAFHNALIKKGAKLSIDEEEYVAGWTQSEPAGDRYRAVLVEHNDN